MQLCNHGCVCQVAARMTRDSVAKEARSLSLAELDLGLLALFVGQELNERVQREIHAAGFAGLRISHGYVFQHLIAGERSVGELSRLLGVSQQAVSKVVRELSELGYLQTLSSEDARVRKLALSARGRAAVDCSRKARKALEAKLLSDVSPRRVAHTRALLTHMLTRLGGAPAVETRRVREPDARAPSARRAQKRGRAGEG